MKRLVIAWLPMVMAASTAMVASVNGMTLQEEREQIGRNMEEGRRQSGEELNAIRGSSASDNIDSSDDGQASGAPGVVGNDDQQSLRRGSGRPGEQSQDGNETSAAGNEPRRSIMRPQQPTAGQRSGGIDANGNASSPNGALTGGNGTSPGNGSGTGSMSSGGAVGNSAGGQ